MDVLSSNPYTKHGHHQIKICVSGAAETGHCGIGALEKAKELGVADITIFTGYVSEAEKADHYRLADVFAMPGSHPEFDRYPYRFVFLEALACGVPVVGCRLEDPWEINDPDSQIIIQVNPYDRGEIIEGILSALSRPKNQVQPGLENYYFGKFETNFHQIVSHIIVGVKC